MMTDAGVLELILMRNAGLDPAAEHGKGSADRFLKALDELTMCKSSGDPAIDEKHDLDCIKWKTFRAEEQDMIIQDSIPFVSLCNHHLVPFVGEAHIGYVPEQKIIGLSKFARVVQHFSRRLQVQENLTRDISDYLHAGLEPKGLIVVMRAQHMCMSLRGIKSPGWTTTAAVRGVFASHDRTAKSEFYQLLNGRLK
jgi:GTP cyclohydrolase I